MGGVLFLLFLSFFLFFVLLPFLGLLLQHMEARGSNRSCNHRPTPQPQQLGIRAVSETYTTAHGNAGPLTH